MKVLREGHKYQLANLDGNLTDENTVQFIEKVPAKELVGKGLIQDSPEFNDTTLVTLNDGTTNEEVLDMLIDRMYYLQGKFPCRENAIAITHLEEALMWLNKRTQDRIKRNVEGKQIK